MEGLLAAFFRPGSNQLLKLYKSVLVASEEAIAQLIFDSQGHSEARNETAESCIPVQSARRNSRKRFCCGFLRIGAGTVENSEVWLER
jgi:hypothetical protein